MYEKTTSCPFPIFADPSRKIYDLLGMTSTLKMGPKPEYIKSHTFMDMVKSAAQLVGQGRDGMKGGDFKQVGGEFLFVDGNVEFVHRMRNTRDHSEISELRTVLGMSPEDKEKKHVNVWKKAIAAKKEEAKGKKSIDNEKATNTNGLNEEAKENTKTFDVAVGE
jgi:AhpC/TSA antioxidant enzyme